MQIMISDNKNLSNRMGLKSGSSLASKRVV